MIYEPLLVSSMRKNVTGIVEYRPDNRPKMGTTTRGFLAELDEYIQSVRADAYNEGLARRNG